MFPVGHGAVLEQNPPHFHHSSMTVCSVTVMDIAVTPCDSGSEDAAGVCTCPVQVQFFLSCVLFFLEGSFAGMLPMSVERGLYVFS